MLETLDLPFGCTSKLISVVIIIPPGSREVKRHDSNLLLTICNHDSKAEDRKDAQAGGDGSKQDLHQILRDTPRRLLGLPEPLAA